MGDCGLRWIIEKLKGCSDICSAFLGRLAATVPRVFWR